jgi:hypothetical protein
MTGVITAKMLRDADKMRLFGRLLLVVSVAILVIFASQMADGAEKPVVAALLIAEFGVMFSSMGRYVFHPSAFMRTVSVIAPMVLIFGTAVALQLTWRSPRAHRGRPELACSTVGPGRAHFRI